jgi:hypothetical protein
LTQVIELHTKQLFTYGWQHPSNSHVGQLIIWLIQRKTHAIDFPEPPEELQWRLTVSLLQGSEVDELLFRATAEVMGVNFRSTSLHVPTDWGGKDENHWNAAPVSDMGKYLTLNASSDEHSLICIR